MSVTWQTYDDVDGWAAGIAARLIASAQDGGTVIVTGGSSPAPIYQRMAQANLPWDRVTLLLSDDRAVPETHNQSNLRLVKSYLGATGATIPALTEDNARAALPAKAGLLGMGPDGHILSWFAGAQGYQDAMTSDAHVCAINAADAAIAQPITDRISLTRKAVTQCPDWHIAIKGVDKKQVAEAATKDPSLYPVGELLRMGDLSITIHWCP